MGKRKEQAALAKKKIMEATENLIRERGYEAIRISDITLACGMTAGNFYHYFASKEDVFNEIDTVTYYDELNPISSQSGEPVLQRLTGFCSKWVDLTLDHYGAGYSYYWVQHYSKKTSTSEGENNRIQLIYLLISQILNEGIAGGELQKDMPAESLAYSMAFTLFGFAAYFGITDDAALVRKWKEDYCEIFLKNAVSPYIVSK